MNRIVISMWPFRKNKKTLVAVGKIEYSYESILFSGRAESVLNLYLYKDEKGRRSYEYDQSGRIALPFVNADLRIWVDAGILPHWAEKVHLHE